VPLRIAFLCYDLASNALGRVQLLADACKGLGDVKIYGPSSSGRVWGPMQQDPRVRPIRIRKRPFLRGDLRRAAKTIASQSDVVFAAKPSTTSYGLGRKIRARHGLPLILDIDDWELGFQIAGGVLWKVRANALLHWRDPNNYFATKRLDKKAARERFKTVSNAFLQRRFGGVLVPHARDPKVWDPSKHDGLAARRRFGLGNATIVLFFGTPRPHKGVDLLVDAVADLDHPDVKCVIVGADEGDPFAARLAARAPKRVRIFGQQPVELGPSIVAMADIVAIPQRSGVGTVGQVPAKIFDAMAMSKPILSTRIDEVAQVLEGAALLVEPDSAKALREGLERLLADPVGAHTMAHAARQRFLKHYSLDAVTKTLRGLIAEAVKGSSRTP
jgi:glycosyltransferase involved in cell wall biosynthesis